MAEAYRGAMVVTTAGYTLGITQGIFLGVINGATAQEIFIAGSAFYIGNTKQRFGTTFGEGVTLTAAPGQLLPVKCSRIKPSSFNVWGVFD